MSLNTNKRLYQPWTEDEFAGDYYVARMNCFERWMYRSLLQKAFSCSWRPHLPNDDQHLWVLAGCDNIKQWQKHKQAVLERFEPIVLNGQELLAHRRVILDWERETQRTEVISQKRREAGLASGRARANKSEQVFNTCSNEIEQTRTTNRTNKQNKQTEQTNGTNGTEPAEAPPPESGETEEEKMAKRSSVRKQIEVASVGILGIEAERYDDVWERAGNLAEAFGESEVVEEFRKWAQENEGVNTTRPVSEFLKTAAGRLRGIIQDRNADNEGNELLADLYAAGDQVFAGKNREAVFQLLKEYPANELRGAYNEFLASRTDRTPFTVKEFAEGGASAILLARRKRAAQSAETEAALDAARRRLEEEGKAEREALKKKRDEDEGLIETELPSE